MRGHFEKIVGFALFIGTCSSGFAGEKPKTVPHKKAVEAKRNSVEASTQVVRLPEKVRKLLNNCVDSGDVNRLVVRGVQHICFPELSAPPNEVEKRLREELAAGPIKTINEGAELREFLGAALQVYQVGSEAEKAKCASEFAQKSLKLGTTMEHQTLGWIDAIAFSDSFKEPTLLLNTNPKQLGLKNGGYLIGLPPYNLCTDQDKIEKDFARIQKQWDYLVSDYESNQAKLTVLKKAFDNPDTVFKVLESPNGCYTVDVFDRLQADRTTKPKNPFSRTDLNASNKSEPLSLDQLIKSESDGYTRIALESLKNQNQLFADMTVKTLNRLNESSIHPTATDIEIKGKKYKLSELAPKMQPGETFDFEEMKRQQLAQARKLGIDTSELNDAVMSTMTMRNAYLVEYRKSHPIAETETYYMDDDGAITTVGLPDGFFYDEKLGIRSENCPNCGGGGGLGPSTPLFWTF
jgi:hypothetical protein